MKASPSTSMLEVQHQIRTNAAQLQDYFSDLYSWEKSISEQEEAQKKAAKESPATKNVPQVRRSQTTMTEMTAAVATTTSKKPPAAHTHDNGYQRWEKFDVEAALREADDGPKNIHTTKTAPAPVAARPVASKVAGKPKVGISSGGSREEIEKEEGNAHYKRGDYVAAIKSYTRCLGYNAQNVVILSNRAMAYIKNKEYSKAEEDCNLALAVDPNHLKSYTRRGTARNALGKHRLALLDFERAAALDTKSQQIQTQLASTRELLRTAIKRAPRRTDFTIEVIGEEKATNTIPEQLQDESANKENLRSSHNVADSHSKHEMHKSLNEPLEKHAAIVQPSIPSHQTANVAAETPSSTTQEARDSSAIATMLPRLPTKAPATSYEFCRVWKTFAPKGTGDRRQQLLGLRADYLRLLRPSSLPTVFKNSIEADILCEIFHVFRNKMLAEPSSLAFVYECVQSLTKVPRFSMTVMFLSDREKEDMVAVFSYLLLHYGDDTQERLHSLMKSYELR